MSEIHQYLLNSLPVLEGKPRIHKNAIFRFGFCGFSEATAASIAGVDIGQVCRWDDGIEDIPVAVRRLWMYESGRKLPPMSGFEGWSFRGGRIITPGGLSYTEPQLQRALRMFDVKLANRR